MPEPIALLIASASKKPLLSTSNVPKARTRRSSSIAIRLRKGREMERERKDNKKKCKESGWGYEGRH